MGGLCRSSRARFGRAHVISSHDILIEAGQALQDVLQEALALQEGTEIHDRLPTVMMPRKIWWDVNYPGLKDEVSATPTPRD